MRGLQLIQPGSLAKKTNLVSSVIRNTSCSRGWLRLLVQTIFAAITVASFILILIMAIPTSPKLMPSNRLSRCTINVCRILCKDTPYFERYEDDIIQSASEVEGSCKTISLTLDKPMFKDNTMPQNWLSKLRTNIHEMTIKSGNLMHIPSDAFMSQYSASIRVLQFKNVVLKTWHADSLVGLSNLRRLYIEDSTITTMSRDALRAVDDTLQSLAITRSEHWDPTNITGTTTFISLKSVDFSSNFFKDILGEHSFTGLQRCQILYLNSCGITSIGAGAFDNLHNIEMLFLHNNHLVTIPAGLFNNIMKITHPTPRINLQDNMWHCDCFAAEIRELTSRDMLLTDPVCYSPECFKYKTFSELEANCSQSQFRNATKSTVNRTGRKWWEQDPINDISGYVYVSDNCYYGNTITMNMSLKLLSPLHGHGCPLSRIDYLSVHSFNMHLSFSDTSDNQMLPKTNWIKLIYFLKTLNYSIVETGAMEADNYGLVWYQSTCPNEVYCVSGVPSIFRIYNTDPSTQYIFCPISLKTGELVYDSCVFYQTATFDYEEAYNKLHILMYVVTGVLCLLFGALCVYALIRKHPHLLKGSKRILFVKHKSVDALVLPPKVPIRNDLIKDSIPNYNKTNIFTVPSNHIVPSRFNRNISTRSSKSSAPSYISALQPTEDQLAEWRLQHTFSNELSLTCTTTMSQLSSFSWISSSDDNVYHSIDVDNCRIYESLK